jgi:dTDP-4-amino-4,6-dideoxygalactose transaminase
VGYNYRLTNTAAALGLAQLETLDELLDARRANAVCYDDAIASIPGLRPAPRAHWADPSFWLYTASVDPALGPRARDRLIAILSEAGIDARPIWTPLHRTRLWSGAQRIGGAVAEQLFEVAFSIPSSSNLDDGRRTRVVEAMRSGVTALAG